MPRGSPSPGFRYSAPVVAEQTSEQGGTSAPPVVAVVVTNDPGDWFEVSLGALARQTYAALSVLVIDTGVADVTERAASAMPSAVVHRDPTPNGFGAAVNAAVKLISGARFYLVMHDDVALDVDAIEIMVEEAFRSNAAVVGPKLVAWNDRRELRSVGTAVDKMGVPAPYAEPGELDQEQHDRVRDAFAVQGGCTLVRADLFETIGGFDDGIDYLGEDIDFCWQAHVLGARVLVAPDAVGRHLESLGGRRPEIRRRQRLSRHRLRTVAKCYGWLDLLRVLPQFAMWSLGEILLSVATGRFTQARDIASSWTWNARRLRPILAARRRLKQQRRSRDSDIRRLQVRGSARFTAYIRGQIGAGSRIQDLAERTRELRGTLSDGPRRQAVAGWILLVIFLLFGARHLITRGIVQFGQFGAFPSRGSLIASYASGWSEVELGSSGVAPAGVGLLGLGATVVLGATAFLRTWLIVGLLPLGWFGAWRLGGPLGSRRGRLAAAVIYAAVPLGYDSIALGRWDALLLYAAMPFVVLRLARLIGVAPYGPRQGEPGPGVPPRSLAHQVISFGFLLAVVAAFEPFVLAIAPALAVVLVVASGLTGNLWSPLRAVLLSVLASALGAALNAPWWLRWVDDPAGLWQVAIGPERGGPTELVDLLRFSIGPAGDSWLLLAIPILAAFGLLLGREWRAAWAPRAWSVAIASIAAAWVSTNELLPIDLPDAAVLLAPAGVGFAWAAGLSFAAFELDVPRFGRDSRRFAIGVGVVSLFAALGPALGAAQSGDFGAPSTDLRGALRFIDANPAEGDFRVLWMGESHLLPAPGREVREDLWVTTSTAGLPDVRANWVAPPTAAMESLVTTLTIGLEGDTARFGRLLAPYAVRYVVVPQSIAPTFAGGEVEPIDPAVEAVLGSQLDLRRIATDPSVVVFENAEWRPIRAVTAVDNPAAAAGDVVSTAVTDPGEWFPALVDRVSAVEFTGPVPSGSLSLAVGDAEDWELTSGDTLLTPIDEADGRRRWDVRGISSATVAHVGLDGLGWLLLGHWIAWVVVARIAVTERRRSTDAEPMAGDPVAAVTADAEPTAVDTNEVVL